MDYQKYIQENKDKLRDRVTVFFKNDKEILFGERKEGMGTGKWVGIGGKVEEGEKPTQAVVRECEEEIFSTPVDLEKLVTMNYFFPNKEKWNQRVHFFVSNEWKGEPKESEEIIPKWVDQEKILFEKCWDDYRFWFNEGVLEERKMNGNIVFDDDNERVIYSEIILI